MMGPVVFMATLTEVGSTEAGTPFVALQLAAGPPIRIGVSAETARYLAPTLYVKAAISIRLAVELAEPAVR